MENIKFIRSIARYCDNDKIEIGNCIYFDLDNGWRSKAKAFCTQHGVQMEIISPTIGKIDVVELPFANYMDKRKLSPSAPEWYTYIDNGHWYWTQQYPNLAPTDTELMRIAAAMNAYMRLFGE